MPLETEVKYLGVDLDALRERLQALGADFQADRFERNLVFDDPSRNLKEKSILVRLREDGRSILTLKRPPEGPTPDGVKTWEEHETELADASAVQATLETLGYAVAFAYEKYRGEWEFGGCHICLDRLPFGDFVEIEGEPEAIFEAARALGLEGNETSTKNYHQLNREFRAEHGLPEDDNFVFGEDEHD